MDRFRQKWSGALDSDSTHFFFAYHGDVWRRYYYNVMVTTYKVRDSRKRKKNSWQLTKKLGCARVLAERVSVVSALVILVNCSIPALVAIADDHCDYHPSICVTRFPPIFLQLPFSYYISTYLHLATLYYLSKCRQRLFLAPSPASYC